MSPVDVSSPNRASESEALAMMVHKNILLWDELSPDGEPRMGKLVWASEFAIGVIFNNPTEAEDLHKHAVSILYKHAVRQVRLAGAQD